MRFTTRSRRRRARRRGAAGALVGAVALILPASGVGAQAPGGVTQPPLPSGCTAPFPPVDAREITTQPPYENDPVTGDEMRLRERILDTDGDGVEDVVSSTPSDTKIITRAAGALVFDDSVRFISDDGSDLDGDGGTDPVITAVTSAGFEVFVLPGSTPSGPVVLAEDAIALPTDWLESVDPGDQDGDGAEDLAVGLADRVVVFSGADVMGPGPGGTFAGDPIATYPGVIVGLLPFDPAAPTLVTTAARPGPSPESPLTLVVHGEPTVELTTGGDLPVPFFSPNSLEAVTVSLVADASTDQAWVVLSDAGRGAGYRWAWELTNLCRTAVADPPTPPAAAPAAPIATEATFTG